MSSSSGEAVHEFSTTFDVAFIRNGIRRDLYWRIAAIVAVFLVAVAGVAWIAGSPPWRFPINVALVAGAVTGVILIPWKITNVARRTFTYWQRLSPDRTIDYRLFPDAVEVKMPNGTARHEWAGMRRLWRYEDIWLLELVRNMSVLVPADAPADARAYIAERCRESGVRV